jgi:glutaredoxin
MYSRTTCGLCDEAREVILAARSEREFDYQEVFVDGNQELERAYGVRVPVILVDGVERFELQVEPGRFREVLAGA